MGQIKQTSIALQFVNLIGIDMKDGYKMYYYDVPLLKY